MFRSSSDKNNIEELGPLYEALQAQEEKAQAEMLSPSEFPVDNTKPDAAVLMKEFIAQEKKINRREEKKRKEPEPKLTVRVKNNIFVPNSLPPIEAYSTDPAPIYQSVIKKIKRYCKKTDFNEIEKLWLLGRGVEFYGRKYRITKEEIISIANCMIDFVSLNSMEEFFDKHPLILEHLSTISHERLYPTFLSMCGTSNLYSCKLDIWERCPAFVTWLQTSKEKMLSIVTLATRYYAPTKIIKTIWDNNISIQNACKYENHPELMTAIVTYLMHIPDYIVGNLLQPDTLVHAAIKRLTPEEIVHLTASYQAGMRGVSEVKFKAFVGAIDDMGVLEKILKKTKGRLPRYFAKTILDRIEVLNETFSSSLRLG